MKRVLLGVFFALMLSGLASAECTLNAKLINQDPYPATPGDYVDVVFQLDGVSNPECGEVTFTLIQNFPFSLDPGVDASETINAGTYSKDFSSFLLVPYKIRVDKDALDGDNKIEVRYSSKVQAGQSISKVTSFVINVQDQRTDFEVSIKDYNPATNTITFEILNVGENDVEALTVDIPKQDNIDVKGSSRNIVGSLDSNEDTSFSFEATPSDGDITMQISYTDSVNQRRSVEKSVYFDSSYFDDRVRDKKSNSWIWYVVVIVVLLALYIWYRIRKKRKHKHHLHHHENR